MSQKTPSQDSNSDWNLEEIKKVYKEAAESDRFLFGDFDYSYVWKNTESNDVS